MFAVTSRYASISTATYTLPDGRIVVYLQRRFIPQTAATVVLARYTVVQGDRLDRIAASFMGDPEQFWRICDVNNAMQPEKLTDDPAIGQQLLISLPQVSG